METTYTESTAGRLYAVGGATLQTVPREVRTAALRGCQDYDIENAHYGIIAQLAHRVGRPTPAIDDYLLRKRAVRQQLVTDIDADIADIKQCLLALLYGATQRVTKVKGKPLAIADTLGQDKAKALFDHPLFSALATEIKTIRKPILESMEHHPGRLVNPFGKAIEITETPAIQLAHVLQGVEAMILDAVIQQHGSNLRALMHDGWVSAEQLDREQLEQHIEKVTGFKVELEEKQLN